MHASDQIKRKVYIGVGGNMGARTLFIDQAVRRLGAEIGSIVATSFLYETAPQLVTDQPAFLNAVVLVEVSGAMVDPHALMSALQAIETAMGRASLDQRQRYGPRPIDLDILCFDDGITTVNTKDLVVPHALLRTRSFVLAPLADIRGDLVVPPSPATRDDGDGDGDDGVTPQTHMETIDILWATLRAQYPDEPLPRRVLPLGAHRIVDVDHVTRTRSPLLMAIVNATPDSFSGDGLGASRTSSTAVETIAHALQEGADVIDIGGHSTRPGHDAVAVDEETRRVLDIVQTVGRTQETPGSAVNALMSIDTFRPEVARACIEALPPSADRSAGVVWINDVMGMRCDPYTMLDLLRQHDGIGIVIMHSRGALDAMVRDRQVAAQLLPEPEPDTDAPRDIVDVVARDLLATVSWAEAHGLPRWRIVLDPGIGFGKTPSDNALLAASAARLSAAVGGYPVLIGASRKSFLSRITATAAKSAGRVGAKPLSDETREHASHAVTAIAAWQGAHVVRVHDVTGSRAVLDVAAAMARGASL
ncbi:HPPK domain and Pterin binding domain containing protein [Pandoravirus macleodensis]|uniref:HPPK domain and Pterin binding domain containing protein n=1 Tax=Pandoravirus macleodensis TaxID=2107707 RepID=A0A2U7UE35_9VIRU|nr:HPPK domain and Pterin binding domain containing protein [Pandoravirus macleodensis]AVK76731.1 HPPK domain and Pterin binding domain containing protein [Pandoravirus macleodensis]